MQDETTADAVRRWLTQAGVPLEFRTALAFRKGGAFDVEHARYYIDVDTGTLRETDVVASFCNGLGFATTQDVMLRVVVECKSAKDPWVAFLGDDVPAYRSGVEQLRTFEVVQQGGYDRDKIVSLYDTPVVASVERYAYQVKTMGKGKEDPAYGATRQVMAAVRGLRADVPETTRTSAVYFVPVIVTAGPLFTCRPGPDGEPVLAQADRVLLISRLVADDDLRSVWVMTEAGLADFMTMLQQTARGLARAW